MEGFTLILGIVGIVWGILNIILFFKIWGMTNDIHDIRELLYKIHPQSKGTIDYRVNTSSNYDNSKFKINDIVVSPNYNGDLKIFDIMGNGEYNCKDANTGAKAGFFKENDLKLKE